MTTTSKRKIDWNNKREEHVMELFVQCVLHCRKTATFKRLKPNDTEFEKDMAHYVSAGLTFGNIDDALTATGLSINEDAEQFKEVKRNMLRYIWHNMYGINEIKDIEKCLSSLSEDKANWYIDEDVEQFMRDELMYN